MPGNFIGASGTFIEGENGPERRAAILIGPEYGAVGRQDIVAAAREAVVIAGPGLPGQTEGRC